MGSLAYQTITGYNAIGSSGTGGPYFQFVNMYEPGDNISIIRGKHSLNLGVSARLKLFHNQYSSNYGHGELDFTNNFTRQIGFGTSGNAIGDYPLARRTPRNTVFYGFQEQTAQILGC